MEGSQNQAPLRKRKSLAPIDWTEKFLNSGAGTVKSKRLIPEPVQFNSQDKAKLENNTLKLKRKSDILSSSAIKFDSVNGQTNTIPSSDNPKSSPSTLDLSVMQDLQLHIQRQYDFNSENYVPMLVNATLNTAVNPVIESLENSKSNLQKSEQLLERSEQMITEYLEKAQKNRDRIEEIISQIGETYKELESLKRQPISIPARVVFFILFAWSWFISLLSAVSNGFSKYLRLRFVSNKKTE